MHAKRRRGSVLVEVLVALVLLATGGVALVTLLSQTQRTMRSARRTEAQTDSASTLLDRYSTFDRAALSASVGGSAVAGLWTRVVEATPGVFAVDVAESDTSRPLLRTTFYRPDSGHASR